MFDNKMIIVGRNHCKVNNSACLSLQANFIAGTIISASQTHYCSVTGLLCWFFQTRALEHGMSTWEAVWCCLDFTI